jgi:hypothetical protein
MYVFHEAWELLFFLFSLPTEKRICADFFSPPPSIPPPEPAVLTIRIQ